MLTPSPKAIAGTHPTRKARHTGRQIPNRSIGSNCLCISPFYHARAGEYLYDASEDMSALGPGKLDLLPGLTWRIAMGEPLFEKFNISPDEISRVCVSTKETTAANGARLWTFQTRNDPLAWRESYDMQLKLDRPDVFFDIAPLRSRFADPVQISDSGKGDALATAFRAAFRAALIDLYPQSATKGITA